MMDFLSILLSNFICIILLSELREKIMKNLILRKLTRIIYPKGIMTRNNMNIKTIRRERNTN